MKNVLISAALAASLFAPAAAQAQALPAAVVAVVDLQRVQTGCNACKTAAATLQAQVNALKARQQTLAGPINTEKQSIQSAVSALNGKEPDAALKARIQAWETKGQQAEAELQRQQEQVQANGEYVQEQIQTKLNPIYSQVMQRRGANLLVEQRATLATATAVDVTNDVIAALNAALPSLSTTAPAATRAQQPQGR